MHFELAFKASENLGGLPSFDGKGRYLRRFPTLPDLNHFIAVMKARARNRGLMFVTISASVHH